MSNIKQINRKSKQIFNTILSLMGEDGYLKLDKHPGTFYKFVAEKYLDEWTCSMGKGYCISLAHYYELNGDLMQAPEVMFFVLDERTEAETDINLLRVYPMTYQQADAGIYDELLKVENGVTLVCKRLQYSCVEFCDIWLPNVKDQQEF